MSHRTASVVLKWMYTDVLEDVQSITFLLELLQAAGTIQLDALKTKYFVCSPQADGVDASRHSCPP